MEITFKNNIAEFEVSSDFNIHLERDKTGDILILQKTAGNKFVDVQLIRGPRIDFDCDFTGYVYPKTIKVISESKVNKGYVTENA